MPRMNWTETSGSGYEPGIYLAEVKKCEAKVSKKADPYLNIEWHDTSPIGPQGLICWDVVMMDGKGRSLGQAKLRALGFDEECELIEPEDLIGRRAWIQVGWQDYNGQKNLKVLSGFEPSFTSGYWSEGSPPDGVAASPTADDTPW